jgi:hypothetical protein
VRKIVVLGLVVAAVWFVATVQHPDNGTVSATSSYSETSISGGNPHAEMREIDSAAGKLKLMVVPPPGTFSTTSLNTDMVIARQNFALEKFGWNKTGFDTVMVADFTFSNKNGFDIKDVEIKCTHSAESGTVIDSNDRIIYQLFRANSKRSVTGFNMGFIHSQVKSSACSIVDFQIVPGSDRSKPPTPTASMKKENAALPLPLR